MTDVVTGTLIANGSVDIPTASAVTLIIGSQTAAAFGGGTLTWQVSHNGVDFGTAHSFTTASVETTIEYVGGVVSKIVLTGATAPSLYYSVKYR